MKRKGVVNKGTPGLGARGKRILLGIRKTKEERALALGFGDVSSKPSFKEAESRKSRVRALDPDSLGFRSSFCLFFSLGQVSAFL